MSPITVTVTLFVNHSPHPNPKRQAELDESLERNARNPQIDRIVVLCRPGDAPKELHPSPKIVWKEMDCSGQPLQRPSFRNFFDAVNEYCRSPYDVSIVAGSDIYFDGSLEQVRELDLEGVCLALTPWEAKANAEASLDEGDEVQDAWIFQGRIRPLGWVGFPMEASFADNRLAWELRRSDYKVVNPCHDLRSYHVHGSGKGGNEGRVEGPWEKVTRCPVSDCGLGPKREVKTGVISFSLWGSEPRYTVGAVKNAELARHVYPGWVVRFYVDDSVPAETVQHLWGLKTEIVRMPRNQGFVGAFWRFLVADDKGFARWAVRDADSRLNYRERRAVDEWIATGAPFHVMRDHPHHRNAILGAAFGGVREVIEDMRGLIVAWPHKEHYGHDEAFLETVIWPKVKGAALVHSAFPQAHGGNVRPFPTEREYWRFVGERCAADEHWNHEDRYALILAEGRMANGS